MTDVDFIYYYAKFYNQYNVKTVLMRENWRDSDFDVKYARYMQEYIKFKNHVRSKRLSDEAIKSLLTALKEKRINAAYDFLFESMKNRMKKITGRPLGGPKEESLKDRLNHFRTITDVNFEYLYEVRQIEEEEY